MSVTSIEWTDVTWNPTRGCSRVSEGCRNCYAERFAARFGKPKALDAPPKSPAGGHVGYITITSEGPRWTGRVELIESKLEEPLHWRKPRRVFVNSMSDLFHEALPDEAIDRVFAVMALCPQHTFQVLTKRAERMYKWAKAPWVRLCEEMYRILGEQPHNKHYPLPNVWLGVSVEDQPTADERIPLLLQTPAAVRFVSYEPALAAVDFTSWLEDADPYATGHMQRAEGDILEQARLVRHGAPQLDWIIIGGESGPGARPFDLQWARNTIQQCKAAGVACFVKQLGANPCWLTTVRTQPRASYERLSGLSLKDRKGGDLSEWPKDLRVREFPKP